MVLGIGASGRLLGIDEVMRVEPHDQINVLTRRGRDQSAHFVM